MPEEGLTRVATVAENYQKQEQVGSGRVGTAGRRCAISQGQRRKGLYGDTIAGPTKARIRFGGIKIAGGRPELEDIKGDHNCKYIKRKRGIWNILPSRNCNSYTNSYRHIEFLCLEQGQQAGKGREVSVGLVRRQETPHQRRTDTGGISKAVLSDFDIGRWWHTEVRPSYHFRVRTKVNSTAVEVAVVQK
ncbi:hypothetical protein BY996DRAFT_6541933 [Phakopsora pachyrhizi]|nr:hypothetical protein BY996DRAFT_6541933 [Phakopsora pachyrhizi]